TSAVNAIWSPSSSLVISTSGCPSTDTLASWTAFEYSSGTASLIACSSTAPRPTRWSRTCRGTWPGRKPGILTCRPTSRYAWSRLGVSSSNGTSTVRRTRVGLSSSTSVFTTWSLLGSPASGRPDAHTPATGVWRAGLLRRDFQAPCSGRMVVLRRRGAQGGPRQAMSLTATDAKSRGCRQYSPLTGGDRPARLPEHGRMTTPHSARPGEPGGLYEPETEAEQARFGPDFAKATWPAYMSAGLGGVIVGVILLALAKATLTIVAVLIGIGLIVAGLLRLIDGFTAHDASGGKRVAYVLIGLLAIVVGLYCIRHFNLVIGVLAVIVGLFWVIHGMADIG